MWRNSAGRAGGSGEESGVWCRKTSCGDEFRHGVLQRRRADLVKNPGSGVARHRVAMSFDVEEWFQTAAITSLDHPASRTARHRVPVLVDSLLAFLGEFGAGATFFMLGTELAMHPATAAAILEAGHELACHGWGHTSLSGMDSASLREDLERCLTAWDRANLPRPSGYRAPSFSVSEDNSGWVADELVKAGFTYDSSVFPMTRHRYGIPGAPLSPYMLQGSTGSILELPLASVEFPGAKVPVAGGAWSRFMPMSLRSILLAKACRAGRIPVLYSHPWEYDEPFDGQPGFPVLVRIRQGHGSGGRMWTCLRRVLESFDSIKLAELAAGSDRR